MTSVNDLKNIEADTRVEIARKAGHILATSDDVTDQKAALELARILAEDVAVSVREALAMELRRCVFLPKDLILTVSQDIEQVSKPFIVASEAIDDAFLEEIVRRCSESHQTSVAQRKGISEAIAFAIADVGSLPAVDTLVSNDTANISERSFDRMINRFPDQVGLMEKLVSHADLPVDVVESLIFKVSEKFGEILIGRFGLSSDYATYLTSLAKRQVFSRVLELAPLAEIENYLRQLKAANGLDSNVLLTYLQNKHLRLFTVAISVLLGRPYEAVQSLVKKNDTTVLARLLDAAGFSKSVIGVLLISYERLTV